MGSALCAVLRFPFTPPGFVFSSLPGQWGFNFLMPAVSGGDREKLK